MANASWGSPWPTKRGHWIVAVETATYGAELAREPRGAIGARAVSFRALAGLLLLRRP
ncbi:hypothetical protein ACNHKD_18915 [Methylocystis sp. JAN1]|uniref:hypothetical protein n=1 Tax=Methylocystis sp. JAN1 TaxID=3397211 RepID=UPI003FA30568